MKKNMMIVALLASLVGSNSFAIVRRVVDGTLNTAGNVTRGTLDTAGYVASPVTGRQARQERRAPQRRQDRRSQVHGQRE